MENFKRRGERGGVENVLIYENTDRFKRLRFLIDDWRESNSWILHIYSRFPKKIKTVRNSYKK